jgi:hypothetical protein
MNQPTDQTAPQDKGIGCLAKGCLTSSGLILFLVIAFLGGTYWAIHHLRQTYSATEPLEMPQSTSELTASEAAPMPSASGAASGSTPVQVPVTKRWKDFEKADEKHEEGNISLSAGDINALLDAGKNTRGKAFVTISNNVGHVRVSIPLNKVFMMEGRYLNGEATVEASPDGNPMSARISNIVINNQPVADSFLDRRLFGWSSIRAYINEWLSKEQVSSFKIENDRVIGQKSGSGSF